MGINEDLTLSVILKNWSVDSTFRQILEFSDTLTERYPIFLEWEPEDLARLAFAIREAIDNACWQATQNS